MFIHLTNKLGEVLYSDVPRECLSCMKTRSQRIEFKVCLGTKQKRRRAWINAEHGSVYLCGDEEALLKSRRLVRERLALYASMLSDIDQLHKTILHQTSKHLKRFMHNLLSQNAHNIQEIYNVASQEVLGLSMNQQIETVKETLKKDPAKAAKAFMRINKNNIAMKCEFSAFKFLYDPSKAELKQRLHKIRKVVMNALHPFFQDLGEKNVHVEADSCDSSVKIDYETVQVALHHIIDNAAKYICPNTTLTVSFPVVEGRQLVAFDMISMQITDEDMERMYEEGYSGELPRQSGAAGDGLGMGLANALLALNDSVVAVRRNVDPSRQQRRLMGVFENNQVDIIFGPPQ
jgi:K+-sensing histidine kinase KdpD